MTNNHCKSCGHPEGAHDNLLEEDFDDPARGGGVCSVEDCGCRGFEN